MVLVHHKVLVHQFCYTESQTLDFLHRIGLESSTTSYGLLNSINMHTPITVDIYLPQEPTCQVLIPFDL